MRKILLPLFLLTLSAQAQQRIDGSFEFQTDPSKDYSIYVPSAYDANTPHRLMLGLHPFNTSVWDAESWCDTLVDFAEANGLLLVCPDGGADGQVDDPIDTAFTSALLDSVYLWYNIAMDKRYAMGFSWGARTTYTYGLQRPEVFAGYLPTGAAITNTNEVGPTLQANSQGKPIYIVHGANDSPNTRFYPVRDALTNAGAIVNSLLMPGVGHTITFPDRNAILGEAFQWIDSVNCANLTTAILHDLVMPHNWNSVLYPSAVVQGEPMMLRFELPQRSNVEMAIYDLSGALVKEMGLAAKHGINELQVKTDMVPGTYFLKLIAEGQQSSLKFVVE